VKRLLLIGNIVAICLVASYGAVEYGAPILAAHLWREDYKNLMFKCDQVMREHHIAKRAVELSPAPETVKNLEATEIGLLDCHAYDKLRKRMLIWGLNEDQLASIGLEALEEKKYELRRFVETHEIRY
jgi:hypothetical protein